MTKLFACCLIFLFYACTLLQPIPSNTQYTNQSGSIEVSTNNSIIQEQTPEPNDSIKIENTWGDYYGKFENLRGESLKRHLHFVIRNHTTISYQQVWNALEFTDQCDSIEDNVVLIYSMRSQAKSQRDRGTKFDYASNGYSLIDSWNREHVWPKSHGFPNEKDTAYTDLHHLRPADRSINSARNTRSFDYSDEVYFDNGGKDRTNNKTSRDQYSWEPPDEVKGDIARMMFYMVVRYEGPDYDLELVDYIVPNNNKTPTLGKLSTLIAWHKLDPVDDRERRRNDLIFNKYQYNRNPFIDHPEFVDLIWN